ncbi:TPA: hypothetical protein DEP90_02800 [Patescibacteria group bacterium]|nr:hypothetical protein [Patescibacteria group bacterium]
MEKITSRERLSYALPEVKDALKWILSSGTATYFLAELLKFINEISLPVWAVLLAYVIINTLSFGIKKFIQGQESK